MNIPIREYWRLLNRYLVVQLGAVLSMSLLLLISTGLNLAAPQIVRTFIDTALANAPQSTLIQTAISFFLIKLMHRAVNLVANYRVQQVAWKSTNALQIDLVAHLVQLDLGFHKTHPPGELIERIDRDVDALTAFLSSFVIDLIGSGLLLIGVLIAIFIEDIFLGGLFTIFSLLALALLVWVQRFAPPHWRAERESSARFWGFLGEILTATEDIQTCGAVIYAKRRFLAHLQQWRPIVLRASLWGMIWLATGVVYTAATTLSWGVGGPLVQQGRLSLGTLYMIGHYLGLLIWGSIQDIQWQLEELQHAQVSIVRVQELFNTTSDLAEGTVLLPPGPLSVKFNAVSFAYSDSKNVMSKTDNALESTTAPNQLVLQNLSFRLQTGRVLGLLGRTGSGKTTLARLLFRLYDPQEGEIYLGEVNLRHARIDTLRARIGLVTQDVQLFRASLRDNLTFFDPSISDETLLATLETLGLTEWLERLPQGLDSPISSETLSAGEAQLVALARVYLKNPDLLILDEASSRLDPATEILLQHALDRLLHGRTAVIIAHRLQTVNRADDILIIEGGQKVEIGPRHLLTANPDSLYAKLLSTGIEEVLM